MATALRVENVSKQYRIYDHPGDRLKESLTRGRWKRHREFWALSDVSFEVETGTTTGIIGPNGSGKSTLLQIITGTLEPTHGQVHIEGRIAALLELGAGFNPEFTGLENIYLNAALMGFSKSETEARMPEIKRFAEIGDFVEQPVKTYSSGMYIRLAFAIAVSADPQILIVDEALAVGDAVFQHRCLRRIKEMQENGATILFVSHDPHTIRALCTRAILFNKGRVETDGKPSDVLNRYQKIIMSRQADYEAARLAADEADETGELALLDEEFKPLSYTYRHGDGTAEILSVDLMDAARRPVEFVETGESVIVRVRARLNANVNDPIFGFLIRDRHGIHIYGTNTEILQAYFGRVREGEIIEATFAFNCWLGVGEFTLTSAVHSADGVSFDWTDDVAFFRVISPVAIEGVSNLNASVTTRRLALRGERVSEKV
ncbi:MAG: lipopolysaccharide transport system ATP-binding protein [Acidobacteriota bacterium]|jgi:ABC-type polysaccharide/polyol phosphate transport system ATPase subunit|nr:lipopolysaccharide transport system ATP-binding protein [Acidobacteriota bacterium]